MHPRHRVLLLGALACMLSRFGVAQDDPFEHNAPTAPFLSAARHSAATLQGILDVRTLLLSHGGPVESPAHPTR